MSTPPPPISSAGLIAPLPRRIRARVGDRTIIDTTGARYVWEFPWYPQYLFPPDSLHEDVVVDEDRTEDGPLGTVSLHTLVLGDRRVQGGARRVSEDTPLEDAIGWWRVEWDAFDAWFEEDEEVIVHPRSPYVRVDSLRSSRHVRVTVDDVVLAESTCPVALFETGLPTRWYLPREDVDMTLLVATDTRTSCPYKGHVSEYWDVRVGDTVVTDAAWSYADPLREALPVAGRIAFLAERVDVTVDGVRRARPVTRHG